MFELVVNKLELIDFNLIAAKPLDDSVLFDHGDKLLLEIFIVLDNIFGSEESKFSHR